MDRRDINCAKCIYFVTTWNPNYPRACKLYGFQGKQWPSVMVYNASGEPCQGFRKKEVQK